jgi:DNA-binding CsgD family transcriptional regulator
VPPELDRSSPIEEGLLERGGDLRQLEDALSDARAGAGRLVVVEGPAGIGKSRLLAAARARAGAAQMRVLTARGTELERSYPFGVVRQSIDRMARESDPDDQRRWLSGAARLAMPVVDPRALDAADAADATFPRLQGLYWLLVNLAGDGPILIAVDDAQWADAASLTFMSFLAPRVHELPVALILACRPVSDAKDHESLARLIADPAATVIRPRPLSAEAVHLWVREAISEDAESAFSAACHQATGGNPFFLDHLVREIAAEQIPPTAAQAERVGGLGPAAVRTVVLVRLGRMPAAAAVAARALAVLGADSPYQDVAALAQLDGAEPAGNDAIAAGIAALEAGGVIDAHDGLRFTHPILQASVYEELPAHARATAHLRAAQLLHERGASADAVASHLLRCEPGVPAWAVDTLREAAEGALAIGHPGAAVDHLQRALQEDNDPRLEGALLVDLGIAEARLGRPVGLEHLSSAIEQTEEPELRLRATLALAKALILSGQGVRAVDVLEDGLRALGEFPEMAASLRGELLGAGNASLPARARVRDLLGPLEDPGGVPETPLELRVLSTLAYNAAVDDLDPERAAELANRALASPALSYDPVTGGESMIMAGAALQAAERLEESEDLFRRALDVSRRDGSPLGVVAAACMRSASRYRRGRLKGAAADVETVVEVAGHVHGAEALAGAVVAVALACALERGAPDDELEGLLAYSETAMDPDLVATGQVLVWRGAVLEALGRHEEALTSLLQCDRPDPGWGGRCPALLQWRSAAVPVLLALGDRDRAAAFALEELELARAYGTPRSLGMALRAAALASDDGRLELQREAVAVLEDGPSPLELARVLVDVGATLRRSGQRREARATLQRAHDVATDIGAVRIAAAARDEILRSGARLRRTAGGPETLTPSELRVAELAVEGQTNRAIAQALFLSEKTIETHLGNVYRKLGVRSRRELPQSLSGKRHSYQ